MRSCFDTLTRRRTAASVQLQIFISKKHTCALKWRSVEALPIVYFIKKRKKQMHCSTRNTGCIPPANQSLRRPYSLI